jgi:SET domain-containing protein
MQPTDSHFNASTAANHRGLNYNFTLNNTQVIDAVACGNNTRYINHSKGSAANCEARSLYSSISPYFESCSRERILVFFVNGDHRIGFFAGKQTSSLQLSVGPLFRWFLVKRISAGQEILFDYGEDYWKNHEHPPE